MVASAGPAPVTAERAAWLSLSAVDDGRLLCRRVRNGSSFAARLRGLIGRASLEADEGLFLPGTSSIHMLAMRFAIDCLFLSRADPDGRRRIVAVRAGLRPWTGVVWYIRGAEGVVELSEGALAGMAVQVGDMVRLEASPADQR